MSQSTPFVNHLNFDVNRLIKTALESKTSKPKPDPNNPNGQPISLQYNTSSIMYEYDVLDKDGKTCKVVAPLCVEGPELSSPSGVLTKTQANGFDSASIFTNFDLTDPEVAQFVSFGTPPGSDGQGGKDSGFWESFYRACMNRVWDIKGQIPFLARIPTKAGLEGLFGYPIFFMRDPNTSQIVSGKNPSKYFNLVSYGKPGSFTRKETLFTVPIEIKKIGDRVQYQKLDWKFLKGVEMRFKPLITFKQLYMGAGKVSLQFEITSAIVTHIIQANTQSAQSDSLAKYASNSTIASNILAQVEALTRSFENASTDNSLPSLPVNTTDQKRDNLNPLSAAIQQATNQRQQQQQFSATDHQTSNKSEPIPHFQQTANPFSSSGLRPLISGTPTLQSLMTTSIPTTTNQ